MFIPPKNHSVKRFENEISCLVFFGASAAFVASSWCSSMLKSSCGFGFFFGLPSRGLTYPTWGSLENHLQNAILGGYVSSLEGIRIYGGMSPKKKSPKKQWCICVIESIFVVYSWNVGSWTMKWQWISAPIMLTHKHTHKYPVILMHAVSRSSLIDRVTKTCMYLIQTFRIQYMS